MLSWSSNWTLDEMHAEFAECEAQISELRNRQAVIVNELDKANVAAGAGHRSMPENLSARFDLSRSTAGELGFAGRRYRRYPQLQRRCARQEVSFERTVAMTHLADAGADADTLTYSESLDLVGVGRLTARLRRIRRFDEYQAHSERFVAIQPTLDESSWRLLGQLPAADGHVVEQALHARSDEFRALPGGDECSRGQRQADALVAMAHDSLCRSGDPEAPSSGSVSVIVDLDEANPTGAETGCRIEYGPRVGPAALEELVCTGVVQIIGLTEGRPVSASPATRAIPQAVRRFVARRDGGCVIAGCTSRHRLEPPHIRLRAHGGSLDPENLATVCWFHHHVAIDRNGLHLHPNSPPLRRGLIRAPTGTDPPHEQPPSPVEHPQPGSPSRQGEVAAPSGR